MYMTPSRLAIAAWLPYSSVASSQDRNDSAFFFWPALRTLTIQSSARPSLCSLTPPSEQGREMPMDAVPYVARMRSESLVAPSLGLGEHMLWAW